MQTGAAIEPQCPLQSRLLPLMIDIALAWGGCPFWAITGVCVCSSVHWDWSLSVACACLGMV
jgi:hypothetical protein